MFKISSPEDVVVVRAAARVTAESWGFGRKGAGEVAIVASELASNMIKYGNGGRFSLERLECGMAIVAEDRGPGIPDDWRVFEDGWSQGRSTRGENYRRGDSLGSGLAAVLRLTDEVEVGTCEELGGACIRAIKHRRSGRNGGGQRG